MDTMISLREFAQREGIGIDRARQLMRGKRIEGAVFVKGRWMLPDTARYERMQGGVKSQRSP